MYMMTYAGRYRGGSSYTVKKKIVLMSGEAVYMYINSEGKLIKHTLVKRKPFMIPAGTPHLFFFPQKSYLFEAFSSDYVKIPHKILRDIKNARMN